MDTHASSSTKELTGRLTEVALGYQRMLHENPREPEALVGITLVALASHQTEAAVEMANAAVAAAPKMGAAWVALGQALKAANQPQKAEKAYLKAIRLDGMDPLARMGLGELKLITGRAEEAVEEFLTALKRQPTMAAAHVWPGKRMGQHGQRCRSPGSLRAGSGARSEAA